jgi:hypothetical protein
LNLKAIFIIMGLLTVFLIVMTVGAIDSNRDLIPYTGRWKGEFTVDSIADTDAAPDELKRWRLAGYVQIYLSNRRYTMHLEGQQQAIDIDGVWSVKNGRVNLDPKSVVIDDGGGAEKRDPNQVYIPNEDVNEAYRREMVLVQSQDKKRYEGLRMSVGSLVGVHRFEKDGP